MLKQPRFKTLGKFPREAYKMLYFYFKPPPPFVIPLGRPWEWLQLRTYLIFIFFSQQRTSVANPGPPFEILNSPLLFKNNFHDNTGDNSAENFRLVTLNGRGCICDETYFRVFNTFLWIASIPCRYFWKRYKHNTGDADEYDKTNCQSNTFIHGYFRTGNSVAKINLLTQLV